MKKNKKIVILIGVFLMVLNIVACGQVKEDETINVKEVVSINQQKNRAQTVESINPETFPVGEYYDDIAHLIISKVDDKNYTVDYGIYKLMYMESAIGNYDANTGILSFSGTDICTGRKLSADVIIQGDNLVVTLTHSGFPDCPTGTTFEFEPGQPE